MDGMRGVPRSDGRDGFVEGWEMNYPPEFRAARLLMVFNKQGGGDCEKTKPFAAWAPAVTERMLAQCPLCPGEVPVIACVLAEERWTLLTIERLIWRNHQGLHRIRNSELWEVGLKEACRLEATRKHYGNPEPETILLDVATKDGRKHRLELEWRPGAMPFAQVLWKVAGVNRNMEREEAG